MSNRRIKINSLHNRDGHSVSTTSLTNEFDIYHHLDMLDLLPTPEEKLQELQSWKFNTEKILKYFSFAWNLPWIASVLFGIILYRYTSSYFLVIDELQANIKLRDELIAMRHQLMHELQYNSSLLSLIDDKIQEAINMYDADKIALVDYALECSGGWITSTPDTYYYNIRPRKMMDVFSIQPSSDPSIMLQSGTLPGQCFAFKGHTGRIRIGLFRSVYITSVTLEHAHKNLALNRSSAPRHFRVYGLVNESSNNGHDFGLFQYKLEGNALQTFGVQNKSFLPYQHVELSILNNHGNAAYTCVYRIRIHGSE